MPLQRMLIYLIFAARESRTTNARDRLNLWTVCRKPARGKYLKKIYAKSTGKAGKRFGRILADRKKRFLRCDGTKLLRQKRNNRPGNKNGRSVLIGSESQPRRTAVPR